MSETKKIVLITGANKGIGFEIARQLGVQDITILVGARNQGRGEATDGPTGGFFGANGVIVW